MQFLRTLIWVLLAVILAAFAFNNWVSVPVRLWGGLIADVNLPLLLALVFALGFLPIYILHATTNWRTKNKLATAERTIADLRAASVTPVVPALAADGPVPGEAPAPAVDGPPAPPSSAPGLL